MFDARMDTVSRHALISLKMANEEDVFDLSENRYYRR